MLAFSYRRSVLHGSSRSSGRSGSCWPPSSSAASRSPFCRNRSRSSARSWVRCTRRAAAQRRRCCSLRARCAPSTANCRPREAARPPARACNHFSRRTEWTGRPARPLPRLVPHASTLCRGGAGWREWAVGGAGRPLYMGQCVPSRCTRGLLTRRYVSSLSTPLHALPSYRSFRRSSRCAGASAAGRTSAPSCSAWRTGASRRELPRALPLPRLHLGHTSVVSRLQELLRTLAALEKTEGDLNDDSLMKEMLFSSS